MNLSEARADEMLPNSPPPPPDVDPDDCGDPAEAGDPGSPGDPGAAPEGAGPGDLVKGGMLPSPPPGPDGPEPGAGGEPPAVGGVPGAGDGDGGAADRSQWSIVPAPVTLPAGA